MSISKNPVTAQLNQEESELLARAQEQYKLDGKGHASVRILLMIGIKTILEIKE